MGEREKVRTINFWPRWVKVGTALRSLLLTAAIPRGCAGRAKGQQQGHLSSRLLKCSSLTASCAGRRRNEMQMDLLPNRLNVSTQGEALLGGRAAGAAELFQRGKCWKVSEAVSTLTYCASTTLWLLGFGSLQPSSQSFPIHTLVALLLVLQCNRRSLRTYTEAPSPPGMWFGAKMPSACWRLFWGRVRASDRRCWVLCNLGQLIDTPLLCALTCLL